MLTNKFLGKFREGNSKVTRNSRSSPMPTPKQQLNNSFFLGHLVQLNRGRPTIEKQNIENVRIVEEMRYKRPELALNLVWGRSRTKR